ncbi:MAG: hypothetical protein LBN26_03820 [Christensenellaceae bacterium]|nr:hypothetical protein [Christensenellaceae bacterium]
MKRSLKDSKGMGSAPNKNGRPHAAKQSDNAQMDEMQSMLSHYSDKSQNELMQELRAAKNSGAISHNDLAEVAKKLTPMLTEEQQKRLFQVMKQLH